MDGSVFTPQPAEITRRRLLQALAAAGITGPLALDLVAQSKGRVSIDALKQASALLGEEFSAERLAVVEKALQRNLDQFQIVRDLVVPDHVEPAPVFMARLRHGYGGQAPRREVGRQALRRDGNEVRDGRRS